MQLKIQIFKITFHLLIERIIFIFLHYWHHQRILIQFFIARFWKKKKNRFNWQSLSAIFRNDEWIQQLFSFYGVCILERGFYTQTRWVSYVELLWKVYWGEHQRNDIISQRNGTKLIMLSRQDGESEGQQKNQNISSFEFSTPAEPNNPTYNAGTFKVNPLLMSI